MFYIKMEMGLKERSFWKVRRPCMLQTEGVYYNTGQAMKIVFINMISASSQSFEAPALPFQPHQILPEHSGKWQNTGVRKHGVVELSRLICITLRQNIVWNCVSNEEANCTLQLVRHTIHTRFSQQRCTCTFLHIPIRADLNLYTQLCGCYWTCIIL